MPPQPSNTDDDDLFSTDNTIRLMWTIMSILSVYNLCCTAVVIHNVHGLSVPTEMLLPFASSILCALVACIRIIVILVYPVFGRRYSLTIHEDVIISLFIEPINIPAVLIQAIFLVLDVTSAILLRNSFHNDSKEPVRKRMHFLAISAVFQAGLAFIMVVIGLWKLDVVGLVCKNWRRWRERREQRRREKEEIRLRSRTAATETTGATRTETAEATEATETTEATGATGVPGATGETVSTAATAATSGCGID